MSRVRSVAHLVAGLGVVALAGGGFAAAASAHVDPDPPAVQAGLASTVSFNVEHGCGDSPTVSLQFKIPDGVTNAKAVAPAGWTGSQDATEVAFTGGSLDPQTPGDFEISFTAPSSAGSISWLLVQKCSSGEIDWFDPTVAGQPEPEHPAPTIKITAGPPTSDDLTVVADNGGGDAGNAVTTIAGPAATTVAGGVRSTVAGTAVTTTARAAGVTGAPVGAPETVTATAATTPTTPTTSTTGQTSATTVSQAATAAGTGTTLPASTSAPVTTPATVAPASRETNGSGSTGLIILVIVVVVILAGGAYVVTRRPKPRPE